MAVNNFAAMPARSLFNSGGSGLQAASERKGFLKFLTVFGSVIPRCLLPSAIAAIEGAIAHRYGAEFFQDVWMHPYSLHVFGMVLGFSLVMRIQIAYQRFWEGATQCSQFASKWADAAMQIVCFDEASKDAFSDHALEFRLQILHYVSLMHAVALCDIRQDAEAVRGHGLTLQPEDPFVFRPSVQQAVLATSNRDVSPTPGRSSTGDLSADASAKGRGISHRHHTVPLAQLLRTRQTLRSRLASSESPPRQTMTERSVFGAEHRRPLGEVYSLLLLLIHHIYVATNARSQMDFPAILALAEAKLCHALASADGERRPDTIEQLRDALLPEL